MHSPVQWYLCAYNRFFCAALIIQTRLAWRTSTLREAERNWGFINRPNEVCCRHWPLSGAIRQTFVLKELIKWCLSVAEVSQPWAASLRFGEAAPQNHRPCHAWGVSKDSLRSRPRLMPSITVTLHWHIIQKLGVQPGGWPHCHGNDATSYIIVNNRENTALSILCWNAANLTEKEKSLLNRLG